MTIVCYIQTKDKIYLGTDSLVSGSVDYSTFGGKMFKKPFLHNNDTSLHNLIIAYSGEVGVAEFLYYTMAAPKWDTDIYVTFKEYIASCFIPQLRTSLMDAGLLKVDSNGCQDSGIHFYIIYNNEVVEIQRNLTMFTSGLPYGAIGSGSTVCYGALDYSRGNKKYPKARLRKCIETTSRLSSSVGGKPEIHIITDSEYKVG